MLLLAIDLKSMTHTVNELLSQVVNFVPKFLTSIGILILGYILARVIAGTTAKFLQKIKIDQLGEKLNDIDIIARSGVKVKISKIIGKIIYYFIMVLALVAATDVLEMPAISNLATGLFNLIPKLFIGLLILLFGILLADMVKNLIQTTLTSLGIPSAKMIANFVFYFLFINVVIVAIAQAEINTEFLEQNISILIAGGVLAFSIGYGLASKNTVANFLASFYTRDKIRMGQTISFNGTTGQIRKISRNSVTIESEDRLTIYPLKSLLDEKIIIHK